MSAWTAGHAQYLSLSNALKQLPGRVFEDHDHPAVVLDRATSPSTQVWGWWTEPSPQDSPALPCLLWCAEAGWSATVVEPDALDSEGYEREFWSHRIKLLDLALANALGPYPTLEDLELHVAAAASFALGANNLEIKQAMRWGLLQLRAARAGTVGHGHGERRRDARRTPGGFVTAELARHALTPTLAKTRVGSPTKPQDPSVDAIVRALSNLRPTDQVIAEH